MTFMRTPSSHSPNRALRARDAGLRKISVATRVLLVGSVAAAGAFAAVAAWAQPGRSKVIRTAAPNATATVPATTPATTPATNPPSGSDDDQGGGDNYLAPPATTPVTQDPGYQYVAPDYQAPPPVVVSGAS